MGYCKTSIRRFESARRLHGSRYGIVELAWSASSPFMLHGINHGISRRFSGGFLGSILPLLTHVDTRTVRFPALTTLWTVQLCHTSGLVRYVAGGFRCQDVSMSARQEAWGSGSLVLWLELWVISSGLWARDVWGGMAWDCVYMCGVYACQNFSTKRRSFPFSSTHKPHRTTSPTYSKTNNQAYIRIPRLALKNGEKECNAKNDEC